MYDAPSLRPFNRSNELSKVTQRIFSQPWAMHEDQAMMVLASLRSKYGIQMIGTGDQVLDGAGMDALAQQGRIEAAIHTERRRGQIFDQSDSVAIIPIEGMLVKSWGLDPWCGITGYDGIEQKVVAASQDDNIKGIWLDIDSGGGDVAGLFDLCDVIWSLNAKNGGKPIFAMVNEHAYSAAYAIASCADKIYMPRYGGVGSVGVIVIHSTAARRLKAEGIDITVIRAGALKARANSLEPLPDEVRDYIQYQVDTIRDGFVKLVSRNMPGVSQNVVRETEAIDYMGEDARAIGFVSGICSWLQGWDKMQTRINRK
jgi:capsid assembly protease